MLVVDKETNLLAKAETVPGEDLQGRWRSPGACGFTDPKVIGLVVNAGYVIR